MIKIYENYYGKILVKKGQFFVQYSGDDELQSVDSYFTAITKLIV